MSEILGVLFKYLLALIAIVAVVAVLYEALGSSNASESVSEVSQIQANVYQLYSSTPNSTTAIGGGGTSTSIAAVIAAGVLPSSMTSGSSSTANDPWGNAVGVGAATSPAVLALSFSSVPLSSCAKIVSGALQAGVSVGVGTAGTAPVAPTVFPNSGNFGPSAATACATAKASSVSILFDFYPSSAVSNNAS